jgi:DNA-binding CsgD family transcriptional regulator
MGDTALAIRADRENTRGDVAAVDMAAFDVGAVLDRAAREIARTITGNSEAIRPHTAALVRRIRTADATYHVRGRQLLPDADGRCPIVVTVERRDPEPPSELEIRQTFGLTRKECTVARLIAQGYTYPAIADILGISRHTARHHAENLMAKLGIRARDRIGEILSAALPAAMA